MVQGKHQQCTGCPVTQSSVGTLSGKMSLLSVMKRISAAEIRALLDKHNHNNARIQELQEHAQSDEAYLGLKEVILNGFSHHRNQLPEKLAGES